MRLLRRLLKLLGVLVLLLVAAVLILMVIVRRPRPHDAPGPAADDAARAVERAVRRDDWERTGAVRWRFAGGRHRLLWDRRRGLVRVEWGEQLALVELRTVTGAVFRAGQPVRDEKAIQRAYAIFCNDMFWLNPLVKLFDDGVTRSLIDTDEGKALLVSYSSGGVTPGDAYLWILGPDGLPKAWRMWVSVLPGFGGARITWEGWQELATGARVSTVHRALGLPFTIDDVAGAETLEALEPGPDPFASLVSK
jgi:hypothetical protein